MIRCRDPLRYDTPPPPSLDCLLPRPAIVTMFSKTPRCQVVPLPRDQVSFVIDGRERLGWHFGKDAPRPFFYPMIGPAGLPLTRMGHPGAPNHDHHRSIWFAHHQVLGIDFWSDQSDAVIRQSQWLAYVDGEHSAEMAVDLKWYDGHDPQPLIDQQLIVSVAPHGDNELMMEIQTSLSSVADSLELGQTSFGLLAVRVAKSLSAVFGGGQLTGENGVQGEQNLFGKRSPWIDYSGPVDRQVSGEQADSKDRSSHASDVIEGITYFDHIDNPNYPSKWHVRDDGWMGASICRDAPLLLRRDQPTRWRYLLHTHRGPVDLTAAEQIAKRFHASPSWRVAKATAPHRQYSITRNP